MNKYGVIWVPSLRQKRRRRKALEFAKDLLALSLIVGMFYCLWIVTS